jgi:uncharacterized tellurite resistance protein B-like protein
VIKALKQYLANALDTSAYEDEAQSLKLACTVMMFEVLRADANTHPHEIEKISLHVRQAFGLNQQETDALMQQARHETEHAVSLHEVIRAVNDGYSPEQKTGLIRMLWDVAYADGELDKYEEHMIRKLADWLYVPHRDFIRTKHQAAAGN